MSDQYDRLLNQKQVAEWLGMSEAWLEQSRFRGVGIAITRRLKEASEIIGIKLLDHLIVSDTEYLSFVERGLL